MAYELETTVLGGLPITVEYTVAPAEPDVGIMSHYVDEWYVTAIAGRPVKKCDWLYRRIKENGDESIVEEACNDAANDLAADYWGY